MPTFAYKAKGADGSVTQGTVTANEQKAAVDQLRQQKLVILEIAESTPGIMDKISGMFKKKGEVASKDLCLFRPLQSLSEIIQKC